MATATAVQVCPALGNNRDALARICNQYVRQKTCFRITHSHEP